MQLVEVLVQPAQTLRDLRGNKFLSYGVVSRCADGKQLQAQRRYNDFVVLHEELYAFLGLPKAFPPDANSSIFYSSSQHADLETHINGLLRKAGGRFVPVLLAFCCTPTFCCPIPAAECLAAMPTATPVQALSLLRGHPSAETIRRAGTERCASFSPAFSSPTFRFDADQPHHDSSAAC